MMPQAFAIAGIDIFLCGGFYQDETKGIASFFGFDGVTAYGCSTDYARDDGQI
jgi:hypothetical protein